MTVNRKIFIALLSVTVICVLFVFGCASKGIEPIENISDAETAVEIAKESNAMIHAPLELRLAEEKLNSAQAAIEQEEFVKAQRLADEALMDAKLAEAKSLSEKAKKRVQEVRESVNTLRRELERTQGGQQ